MRPEQIQISQKYIDFPKFQTRSSRSRLFESNLNHVCFLHNSAVPYLGFPVSPSDAGIVLKLRVVPPIVGIIVPLSPSGASFLQTQLIIVVAAVWITDIIQLCKIGLPLENLQPQPGRGMPSNVTMQQPGARVI